MMANRSLRKPELIRLILLSAILAGVAGFILSGKSTIRSVHAFSSGPPAGYTGAPREEPEACAECHVPSDAGTGQISITAPSTYIPGQTYPITVTHTNPDPTRIRWGFQLTALDTSDEQAGTLTPLDGTTQVLNNAGPNNSRQYIEHTATGTFIGQQNSVSWHFNWTAPPTDIGFVTFYAAGNHANNDGNSSGDYIYRTFVALAPASSTPDIALTVTPSSRTIIPGGSTSYTVTVTPLAGFTGVVGFGATGLPAGVTAGFSPASVNITDATSKTSTVTLNSTVATPFGTNNINFNATSGSVSDTAQAELKVVNPASVDLSITGTASPNPGQVGVNLSYRLTAMNNGPATATNVMVVDTLPAGVTFISSSSTQGSCSGTSTVTCAVGTLSAGSNAVITITVTPTLQGQLVNNASISGSETDFDTTNNTASLTTLIQPAAATPTMLDSNLTVSPVITGLDQPTSMAFLGPNDFFILERATGKVQRVVNGALQSTVLDLAVNNASERGLLGIALHPKFAQNGFVYLYWTESSTGVDTANADEVPLLGNRVDRYIWNGSTLTPDLNLIKLRALQQDAGQPSRGNHNGGVLRVGPDGKVYIIMGDNGRRGLLQNITSGGPVPDDQFGGPEPDNAHMTGVILRLNEDGSTPSDNPFFNTTTTLTGEAAANIKKLYAYGVRNSFGMAFDPLSGSLWTQENGDDAFDEINRVIPGFNGGWIQTMGPLSRIAEFKSIESTYGAGNLQQLRWPPSNIANTSQEALSRMFMLPGAQYVDPEFSWKYAVAPSPIGFVNGRGLGPQYEGDLFVGASRTTLLNGFLLRFKLTPDRQHFSFTDQALADRVADNVDKFDQTESESLVIGRDFGIATDIQTGPNGNVFVVSLSNGAVYEIKSKPSLLFLANLTGAQEVPATGSTATGTAALLLSPDEKTARISLNFSGLSSAQTAAHIHGAGAPGISAPVLFPLPNGQISDFEIALAPGQADDLKSGLWYVNVHSTNFPNGEIRGQLGSTPSGSSLQLGATKYVINEGQSAFLVSVSRLGGTSSPASVDYATSDTAGTNPCGTFNSAASSRCDYLTTAGKLLFAAGETSKTISIPVTDDVYAEGVENFTLTLSNAIGATLGPLSVATLTINDNETINGTNPIDSSDFFVRQHYIDFLNREPDPGGFGFWTNEINVCGNDAQCLEVKRINVSAAFFLSIEFQETGYLVYRVYKSGLGNLAGAPVPVTFNDFIRDTQRIGQGVQVGVGNWESILEANKQAYALEFVQRADFLAAFPNSMTAAQFVDKLNLNAGGVLSDSERTNLINVLGATPADLTKRASVLRSVAEDTDLRSAEFNRAFVLMQYFGYLRRSPNDAPDSDFSGYNFWLNKLNSFGGNFVNAEMVKAFILSSEYRHRFGP
jgi:uncharacterized repeat protein (TIGR01451 family)